MKEADVEVYLVRSNLSADRRKTEVAKFVALKDKLCVLVLESNKKAPLLPRVSGVDVVVHYSVPAAKNLYRYIQEVGMLVGK